MPDERITIRIATPDDALDWCRAQGIERVAPHASSMGRPLYDSLGFTSSNEMVLYVK